MTVNFMGHAVRVVLGRGLVEKKFSNNGKLLLLKKTYARRYMTLKGFKFTPSCFATAIYIKQRDIPLKMGRIEEAFFFFL